ncbi:hypothetical protein K402DRAFT_333883 [Aulographum hederae CBS 113979]|uniref:Uncharacterized protein n=1 Tax=Aulographum hederae CBS 113979 TaxID=1176131 RepID=A0A6G1GXU5_9PEZI|nr:hypothetical protein K402DRAFT_333883 [Aulographum hederae CBS 113979]
MNIPVFVEPYNLQWAKDFEHIKGELEKAVEGVTIVGIEHVGSTSIPGLCAKPIIDIDIVVTRDNLPSVIAALSEKAGYWHRGEMGVPDRYSFRIQHNVPPRNLYVCIEGCLSLKNHLCVRKVLRENPGLREEYGRVKSALAAKGYDIYQYVEGKNDILQKILELSDMSDEDRKAIRDLNTNLTPPVLPIPPWEQSSNS